VSVVCCQVEVSATGWSLVQRSPTECSVSKVCVIANPRKMRRPRSPRGCRAIGKERISISNGARILFVVESYYKFVHIVDILVVYFVFVLITSRP
jgi:hypothetical protein